VQSELRRSGLEELIAAGIVLTGGTAKMEGVIDLAEEIFHMPVRLGMPHNIQGLADIVNNPIYSTGVGLLLYGLQQQQENRTVPGKVPGSGWVGRIRKWFQNNL
jgi:cell division protein FtsA